MSNLPTLAIVGRPNVGKSALFNRICQKRIAIVDEMEGVTRDRIYANTDFFGFAFRAIDTGGMDPLSSDSFQKQIQSQAEIAITEADTIVMVVDGQVGPTDIDERLAKALLKTGKPLCLAVNKLDDASQEYLIHNFHKLGISKIIPISALQGYQIPELVQLAWKGLRIIKKPLPVQKNVKISVVGRPNVGKSTLLNCLLNEERCIVSPIAGTTRDTVDIPFSYEGKDYLLIDTAGIRRKKAEKDAVEKFAALRTQKAIERSDVCLLILDVQEGITAQEKKIINQIETAGKGCIVLLNKWDLVTGFRMEHCLKALHEECPFLAYCPTIVISAKTGRNVEQVFSLIETVYAALGTRIPTHQLNKFLERAMQLNHPTMIKGKRLRIYYMTQVKTHPPTFVFFVNYPELMMDSYKRYLLNQFREHFPFPGVPLVFELRGKEKNEEYDYSRNS